MNRRAEISLLEAKAFELMAKAARLRAEDAVGEDVEETEVAAATKPKARKPRRIVVPEAPRNELAERQATAALRSVGFAHRRAS
jgi:hypothetical protein